MKKLVTSGKWSVICFLLLMFCGSARAQIAYASTTAEASHLLQNGRGQKLYNLNVYNTSASTVYLFVYDSYTAATPAVAATVPADWNFGTGVLTTEETHTTWSTGTDFYFTINGAQSDISLLNNGHYYLIKLTSSTFKIAGSLENATAGRALTLTGANAASGYNVTVLPKPLPPVPIPAHQTASITYTVGRKFSNGIWVVGSSTDTSLTAISPGLLFDVNYSD